MKSLARFGWTVLGYNLAVIVWGAYVRATRSGAGCGAHWPLCNGQVLPSAPSAEMLVEFSHRLTSGLALLSVVALFAWTWRACQGRHPARRGAAWAVFFMMTEAAVGAALVLFRLVADNQTMARAMFMSVHLVNTFALLAALALTAWWLSGGAAVRLRGRVSTAGWLAAGAAAMLLSGVSGAVAALGDTLYPPGSLAEAFAADLSATSHLFIRLRILHPAITITVATVFIASGLALRRSPVAGAARFAVAIAGLAATQVAAGFINVLLLAPVWMQLVHLLVADALWICCVLLGASLLADQESVPAPAGS